ncbi:hypothetical protein CHUAL_005880 [Chamberlinius hualienensis]
MASSCPDISVNGEVESDFDTSSSTSGLQIQNGCAPSSTAATDKYGFIGGSQYTQPGAQSTIPAEVLRKRELKWLEMLDNWEKYMTKRYKKVRDRCRKGIPPSLRARAWQLLCGSQFLQEQSKLKFTDLDAQSGDVKWVDDIKKDLHRQFPFHEMFMSKEGHGQEDLFRILKAYSIYNPDVGYCQAQAPIAAILLMHMPAEQAFWCLVSICDKYLPGYYSQGLEAIQVDGDILFGILRKVNPQGYRLLRKQHIEPVLYMTEWFMCVFTRTLPWSSVLRVWDMFFCEGVKVIFRTALVLLKFSLSIKDIQLRCPTMYETLDVLRNLPKEIMQEDFLVQQMFHLGISEHDMAQEHSRQITKRRSQKEKLKSNGKS